MKALLARYQQLTEREQRIVLVGSIVLILFLFYSLIWSPLSQSVEQGRKNVAAQQKLLSWVSANANKAQQLRRGSNQNNRFSGSLPQAVNQLAQRYQIPIARMQPNGSTLQLWVDQADFAQTVDWLKAIEDKGIDILDVDIAETTQSGQIKIRRLLLGKS
ncbi:type II secretion system protein GspM [Neptunicella marina]|uniref:Type II secretion system protein M n=1 Tax=Neptunicella marina TaxID=2125989 RepID=A0A8J6ITY8_9ALTE|nr:type II secretion system protein M [Neptunicella marina]MBC3765872.1 type II secretion system protein M [Neptunicella marina]